jgi:hypothetical protein
MNRTAVGLPRASTSFYVKISKDVDGRVKPGHDENLWPICPSEAVNRRKNS